MASLNKVILIGNLGKDPEIRRTQDGRPIANLQDLRQAFATPVNGFHVVDFLAGQGAVRIVLDASEAAASRQRLQQAYGVERLDSEPREPAQSLSR